MQDLTIGDEILIMMHPERFLLETLSGPYKVLRRFGSSAYELDIPRDLGINPVFSVEDLTRSRTSTGPQ